IVPSRRPTASPLVPMRVRGQDARRASSTGVLAILIALKASCSGLGFSPQPSRTMRTQGMFVGWVGMFFAQTGVLGAYDSTMGTSRRILSQRFTCRVAVMGVAVASMTGCQVDEITFGVGNARTEDAFGN